MYCTLSTCPQRCVFPFSYKGLEYGSCTTADNGGVAWCSTATDHRGRYVAGRWGDCEEDCPLGRLESKFQLSMCIDVKIGEPHYV